MKNSAPQIMIVELCINC